jgi:radical SAM protein with 4Fe4S-binding SPASM domain
MIRINTFEETAMGRIDHILSQLELTEKTKQNLKRKSSYVDEVQITRCGIPLFSWIDISLTELCNRRCTFCPRSDPGFYPNQNLFFDVGLAAKIGNELLDLDYKGIVVLCGYGEPFMHPQIYEVISALKKGSRVEVVTNGDYLNVEVVRNAFEAGLDYMCISMYDGPNQVEKFTSLMEEAGISADKYILRDRWHTEEDGFGLKLTNRSGVLNYGPDPSLMAKKPCYYLAYSLTLDWNGDVLMCVQDWSKRVKLGNVNSQTLFSVWSSPRLQNLRSDLISGNRSKPPCATCNADGTLHGFNHANQWVITES